jgi:hypothetical protein
LSRAGARVKRVNDGSSACGPGAPGRRESTMVARAVLCRYRGVFFGRRRAVFS